MVPPGAAEAIIFSIAARMSAIPREKEAITLFNNGELADKDFVKTGVGVSMKRQAKRTVVAGYERWIQTEITHPIFGYKVSYRRVLEVQGRLLARVISGEILSMAEKSWPH